VFYYVETKSEVTLSAHQIFSGFFTVQVVTELCRQLVLIYFPLCEDELKCWLTDPENFSEFEYFKTFSCIQCINPYRVMFVAYIVTLCLYIVTL